MDNKELLLKELREGIKKHRDQIKESSDPHINRLVAALDTFLLVSYNPIALQDLCRILSDFLNKQLGTDQSMEQARNSSVSTRRHGRKIRAKEMKHIKLYESFLNEANVKPKKITKPTIISGKAFMKQYVTTDHGNLEKAYFRSGGGGMGSSLGKGSYYSVTAESADHYQMDDFFKDYDELILKDDAKILLFPDSEKYSGSELKKIAQKEGADGLYNPLEGKNMPYYGLVIYNKEVIY